MTTHTQNIIRIALAGAGAVALAIAVGAAAPQARSPQPSTSESQATTPGQRADNRDGRRDQDRPDRPEGERGMQGGPDGPGRGGPPRGMWLEPTQEQWNEAISFLRENSPRRLEMYDKALADWRSQQAGPTTQEELPRSIRGARARIFGRVQMLRMVERGDPGLYTIALQQFRLEDQIIGALHDAREAHLAGNEPSAQEATTRAQDAVSRYAHGTILEREQRIARMREELAREEQRLQEDRSQMDRLVERLFERFRRSVPGNQGPRDGSSEGRGNEGRGDQREGGRDGAESKSGG